MKLSIEQFKKILKSEEWQLIPDKFNRYETTIKSKLWIISHDCYYDEPYIHVEYTKKGKEENFVIDCSIPSSVKWWVNVVISVVYGGNIYLDKNNPFFITFKNTVFDVNCRDQNEFDKMLETR